MKKLLLFLALVALNFSYIWAFNFAFTYNGQTLYYNIVNGEAQVTYPSNTTSNPWGGYTRPRGSLVIPATVSNNNTDYPVTSIGEYAFSSCSSLTSVTIPNSVTSIARYAFSNCTSLASVTIPSSVTSIHDHSFYGCSGLTSISVAQGNPTFDSRNNCNAIIKTSDNMLVVGCRNTNIPSTVTSIGDYAFHRRSGLSNVTIPYSVTSIGRYAFNGCVDIVSINLPNSVQTISSFAFIDCSGLTSVTIPSSVTSIGSGIFAGCTDLTSISVDAGNTVYDSRNNCNAIIETITNTLIQGCKNTTIPNDVTKIYSNAFYDQTGLTSISIPNSVTSIENAAFSGCSGLRSITVEAERVPSVGTNAFSGVPADISVNVPCRMVDAYQADTGWSQFTNIQEDPNSPHYSLYYTLDNTNNTATVYGSNVNSFGNPVNDRVAIDNCGTFANLVIPSSVTSEGNTYTVTSIGESAFYENSDLVSVEIPESVTSIGKYAFNRCSSLASATIPNTVTTIGEGVFYYCENLASVTIGNGVTSISPNAFEGCGLTSITIPNNVTSIGSGAFRNCSSLQSVNIPENVTIIGDFVFIGCTVLASISVEADNTVYDSRNNCNAIIETSTNTLMSGCKNTVIPDSVTVIGDNAFNGCTGLTSITIPNSVTTIEAQAFMECSGLERVTFDNSPTAIGNDIFKGCSRLSSLSFGNSVTTIGSNAFQGCSSLETLTIPSSVNSILGSPFKDCISLAEIIVEAGNNTYDSRNGCNAIIETSSNTLVQGCNNTVIPNSVTAIAEAAFYGCSGLTSVTIPNSVTTIGRGAFSGCSGLTSVTIPNLVTTIGWDAFSGCSSLTSVTIPNSVTTIGPNAFYGCSGLESVTIPRSVTDINQYAFSGCSGLESVTIPDSVTTIGPNAFYGCSGLKSVVKLSSTNNINHSAFNGCENLKTIYLYNGQSRYQDPNGYSFYGCRAKRIVRFTASGSGLNALYVIEQHDFRVIDQPESSCQSNQIPKADLPDNFICLAEGGSGWKARNIVLTDCEDEFEAGADITADHAIYKRDFANGNRSTLYLPFTAAEKPDGFEVYEFSEFTDNTLRFTPLADNAPIAAYTPYLVGYQLAKDGSTTCTIEQTDAMFPRTVADAGAVTFDNMTFHGTMQRTEMTSTNNYGYKDGYFVQSGGSAHVNPFRCYFSLSDSQNASPILNVDTDGDYLSIDEVEGNVEQPAIRYSNDVYDLMGRLVRKNADSLRGLPRGIYIWKGQKVLNYR